MIQFPSSLSFLISQFVDPFLYAGSISSGTSLDKDRGQGLDRQARSHMESFDDSDGYNDCNDFDDDGDGDSHEEVPKSFGKSAASSLPASSLRPTFHRSVDTDSSTGNIKQSI